MFQFDNIPVDGADYVPAHSHHGSSALDPRTDSADSGIFIGGGVTLGAASIGGGSFAAGGGHECITMLTPPLGVTSALRPPPPPRNKLKRIEAVEESVCDTTFSTAGVVFRNSPASQPDLSAMADPLAPPGQQGHERGDPARAAGRAAPTSNHTTRGQPQFKLWAMSEFQAPACTKEVANRVHKMADIKNLVRTSLHRPAFRIPKADF